MKEQSGSLCVCLGCCQGATTLLGMRWDLLTSSKGTVTAPHSFCSHHCAQCLLTCEQHRKERRFFRCSAEFAAGTLAHELHISSHGSFCNEAWDSAAHRFLVIPESFWSFLSQKMLLEMQLFRHLEPSPEVIQHCLCFIRDHYQEGPRCHGSRALKRTQCIAAPLLFW